MKNDAGFCFASSPSALETLQHHALSAKSDTAFLSSLKALTDAETHKSISALTSNFASKASVDHAVMEEVTKAIIQLRIQGKFAEAEAIYSFIKARGHAKWRTIFQIPAEFNERLASKPWWDAHEFPLARRLRQHFPAILEEFQRILNHDDGAFMKQASSDLRLIGAGSWTEFPLYTFPRLPLGPDSPPAPKEWYIDNCCKMPTLCALLFTDEDAPVKNQVRSVLCFESSNSTALNHCVSLKSNFEHNHFFLSLKMHSFSLLIL